MTFLVSIHTMLLVLLMVFWGHKVYAWVFSLCVGQGGGVFRHLPLPSAGGVDLVVDALLMENVDALSF